jgi:hypothetical protein
MMDSRVQRLIAEVLFPLMGILFWDWTLNFIVWFYAIDLILTALVNVVRNRKTILPFEIALPFAELSLLFLIIFISSNGIGASFFAFLSYKDMGIAQGYFLVPILLLNEWLKWKMELKTKMVIVSSTKSLLLKIAGFGLLLTAIFAFGLTGYESLMFLLVLCVANISWKPHIYLK